MKKSGSFIFFFCCLLMPAFSQNADIDLLRTINENRTPQLDTFFVFVTNTVGWLAYIVPIGLLAFAFFKKHNEGKRKALLIGISALTAALIVNLLKHSINKVRPFITYPFITKLSDGGSPSFPSGHTSDAFVMAAALSIGYPKWYVIVPAYLWALAVGYSRMYLGVHYPSDVLAGAITGTSAAIICYVINKKLLKKAVIKAEL